MVVVLISICRQQPLQFFEPIQSPGIGGQIDIAYTTGPAVLGYFVVYEFGSDHVVRRSARGILSNIRCGLT